MNSNAKFRKVKNLERIKKQTREEKLANALKKNIKLRKQIKKTSS